MLDLERKLWNDGYRHVAGLDEAGRGCLAGPVVAAAVILPPDANLPTVTDSKKLSRAQREAARPAIEAQALAIGIGRCTPAEIDAMNILQAALEAMRRAARHLAVPPDYGLVDGNQALGTNAGFAHEAIVKGDGRSLSIAAASVVAKTERDALMRALHARHPAYGWDTNVGYPTRAHYNALAEHGPTPHHRRSFRLNKS
jgi:ribonuclease HII